MNRKKQSPSQLSPVPDLSSELEDSVDESLLHSWIPTVPSLPLELVGKENDPMHLPLGEVFGDFFIRSEIGRGAFGVVYLAEQLSLRRTVALKVTDLTRGDGCDVEGQTMAQLEHPSIVRVYSQSIDEEKKWRLLCMQYVAGMNLRSLLKAVKAEFGSQWEGRQLLEILNRDKQAENIVLQETSIADRELLDGAEHMKTICWIGAQTALALDHAHQAGYVHCDVKPENTIISRFGRPMLVDFNLASSSSQAKSIRGGTLPYMSPEAIKEFASIESASPELASSADVYGVGVMAWEMADGSLPFKEFDTENLRDEQKISELLESRRSAPSSKKINSRLEKVLQRAVDFHPSNRYQSAGDFARSLLGVAAQEVAINFRFERSIVGKWVASRPVLAFFVAAIAPHILASIFQIAYNQAEIVSYLTPESRNLFDFLLLRVNPVLYGICVIVGGKYLYDIVSPFRAVVSGKDVDSRAIDIARENVRKLPDRVAVIGGLGWLAGMIVFPGWLWVNDHFGIQLWLHFILSFVLCGAIAITFSYALVFAVSIFSFYPILFSDPADFRKASRRELEPVRSQIVRLTVFAGCVPLVGAILLVLTFSPNDLLIEENSHAELAFKGLVVGLIFSSVFGFYFVRQIGRLLSAFIDKCVGSR